MNQKTWRILLIEDLPIYTRLLENILQQTGITLDTAQALAEGIQKAQSNCYDAVLLDLGLPDSRGLNTFRSFSTACPSLPIIIFSGTDDEETALQAMQNGAQDYLIKSPYLTQPELGSHLIVRSIAYAIERHKIQTELLVERSMLEQRVAERTKELMAANERLQKLASSLVSAQEDERRRISLELHDEASQLLTVLKLSLNQIQAEIGGISAALASQIQEANQLTDTIINQLRTLAHELRPPALDTIGLNQLLGDFCQKIARQAGLAIFYSGTDLSDLPSHVQISLFRACQEALTNVVKHAKATRVEVSLQMNHHQIALRVTDNGCGFDIPESSHFEEKGGIGLLGLRDRIEAIGGKLVINSKPGAGTRLSIHVPVQEHR